ncbi:CRISPR system Cascade subunit CasB [Spinactinospora alkalitolerans]|uniref:CRISPR system Cascade subunit CasB n=1 Tax=Spinactinospora alkalitolerans TaxID=687207 RepID=A0A852U7U4_9ACTN|nr:type I-E CRISPR-associated protein Cse2/CasB [Spinactinospora alkalitolerans]NYE50953.1 CRISPR system Cascade subunit CasB [Spinactinospora alkalitolerans]
MSSERILHRADALVERVRTVITGEPAARAALRRGVGLTPEDPRMIPAHGIVAPYTTDEHSNTERAFYAVAAIMAAQTRDARGKDTASGEEEAEPQISGDGSAAENEAEPVQARGNGQSKDNGEAEKGAKATGKAGKRPNLGVTLAKAVIKRTLNADTTEQRLHLLARQPIDGVHRHLPRLVLHLRGNSEPVDWGLLIRDLARWGHSPGQVAKEWVQGYHRTLETDRRKAKATTTATTEGSEAA